MDSGTGPKATRARARVVSRGNRSLVGLSSLIVAVEKSQVEKRHRSFIPEDDKTCPVARACLPALPNRIADLRVNRRDELFRVIPSSRRRAKDTFTFLDIRPRARKVPKKKESFVEFFLSRCSLGLFIPRYPIRDTVPSTF